MENVEATLLALKEQALNATKRKDGAFYQNYLADNAIAITPFGIFNKEAIVAQMSGESAFRSLSVEDTRAFELTPESGLVTYKAIFQSTTQAERTFTMFVTTVYTKVNGKWQGILYQQTPQQQRTA